MKILSVIHYPTFGGPHNQAVRLARPLQRRGWETLVALPAEPGNAETRLLEECIEVVSLPLYRVRATWRPDHHARFAKSLAADIERIRSLIRSRKVDLVQVSGLVNPHAGIAARLERLPVVWQLLDTRAPLSVRIVMAPVVHRLADVVMSTGLKVAAQHPGMRRLGDRLLPYTPPVDLAEFRPDSGRRQIARSRLGIPEDAVAIGTLANLNPQKGHEHLLRAFSRLRPSAGKVCLRILGSSTPTHLTYRDRLLAEASRLGLARDGGFAVIDPGREAHLMLPGLDIFALASTPRSEGIPTVVLEAMACGLPVVATDVGAVTDVVSHGITGFVTDPSRRLQLTRALDRLVHDPSLRASLGSAGRAKAEAEFGIEGSADAHAEAYRRAVARRRSCGL
jgi:glycosyltransferase involved in cell wall biosynthesis